MVTEKLYMILMGASPRGRHTEQHDVFFGIANSLKELIPEMNAFWPDAKGKLHIDGWREVTRVDGFEIHLSPRLHSMQPPSHRLFFLNLGGYKKNELEEFHYKMLVAATDKGQAVQQAKQTAFYKHTGFKGAGSHIDNKYGVDVDDIFEIRDVLPSIARNQFSIELIPATDDLQDEIHLGYFRFDKLP